MASSVGLPRPLEGRRICVGGESCGVAKPFGDNDIVSGVCSSDRPHRVPRDICKAATVAIALLDHVRLEG